MSNSTPLGRAIEIVGLSTLAKGLRVSHQAVRKWEKAGRMPRTEWTGETSYSDFIETATGGVVKKPDLLAKWPTNVEEMAQ